MVLGSCFRASLPLTSAENLFIVSEMFVFDCSRSSSSRFSGSAPPPPPSCFGATNFSLFPSSLSLLKEQLWGWGGGEERAPVHTIREERQMLEGGWRAAQMGGPAGSPRLRQSASGFSRDTTSPSSALRQRAETCTMTQPTSKKQGFKKCRSATFSIDGFSFTIGETELCSGAPGS